MTTKLRKAAVGALAALTIGAGLAATATPSAAQGWRGGGGYRWHTGYWHRGYGWGGGYGWGEPLAVGAIGGFTLGALTGAAYAYGPAYYGGGCYLQNRPVYDSWGNFAGYSPVQVCY
jgi:hypothetical protein